MTGSTASNEESTTIFEAGFATFINDDSLPGFDSLNNSNFFHQVMNASKLFDGEASVAKLNESLSKLSDINDNITTLNAATLMYKKQVSARSLRRKNRKSMPALSEDGQPAYYLAEGIDEGNEEEETETEVQEEEPSEGFQEEILCAFLLNKLKKKKQEEEETGKQQDDEVESVTTATASLTSVGESVRTAGNVSVGESSAASTKKTSNTVLDESANETAASEEGTCSSEVRQEKGNKQVPIPSAESTCSSEGSREKEKEAPKRVLRRNHTTGDERHKKRSLRRNRTAEPASSRDCAPSNNKTSDAMLDESAKATMSPDKTSLRRSRTTESASRRSVASSKQTAAQVIADRAKETTNALSEALEKVEEKKSSKEKESAVEKTSAEETKSRITQSVAESIGSLVNSFGTVSTAQALRTASVEQANRSKEKESTSVMDDSSVPKTRRALRTTSAMDDSSGPKTPRKKRSSSVKAKKVTRACAVQDDVTRSPRRRSDRSNPRRTRSQSGHRRSHHRRASSEVGEDTASSSNSSSRRSARSIGGSSRRGSCTISGGAQGTRLEQQQQPEQAPATPRTAKTGTLRQLREERGSSREENKSSSPVPAPVTPRKCTSMELRRVTRTPRHRASMKGHDIIRRNMQLMSDQNLDDGEPEAAAPVMMPSSFDNHQRKKHEVWKQRRGRSFGDATAACIKNAADQKSSALERAIRLKSIQAAAASSMTTTPKSAATKLSINVDGAVDRIWAVGLDAKRDAKNKVAAKDDTFMTRSAPGTPVAQRRVRRGSCV